MRTVVAISLFLLSLAAHSQHIAITGTATGVDTLRITIMSEGEVLSVNRSAGSVYSIMVGGKDFYVIRFDAEGKPPKYIHLFCYKIDTPVAIVQNVNFRYRTNLLIRLEKAERSKGFFWKKRMQKGEPQEFRYYWGEQASWRSEF